MARAPLRRALAAGRWLALPLGLALAAAFAPLDFVPLALLCPAALFLLWHGATPREAAWRGFLFTAGTFLAGTYWLYHSIHLVGQAPVWLALFLMLGLVAIMGASTITQEPIAPPIIQLPISRVFARSLNSAVGPGHAE